MSASQSTELGRPRIQTIDCLRGIASLSVCWFHFTGGNQLFLGNGGIQGALKLSGSYGWLGVEIFFVISGFIIPYALWRADYRITQYGRFLIKRVLRLDPPYLASIAIAIVLAWVSYLTPGHRGPPPHFSLAQVAAHLGYANAFFRYDWIVPAYWTLAIEFQYYLAIGLLFPLLLLRRIWGAIVLGILFYGSQLLFPSEGFVFHWLFLFSFGLVTFRFKASLLSKRAYFAALVLVACLCASVLGPLIATVGAATAIIIAFGRISNGILRFFGDISYSLYLLHEPIGMRVVSFSLSHARSTGPKLVVLPLALGSSVVGAYLLYRAVELPARRWSSKLAYRSA